MTESMANRGISLAIEQGREVFAVPGSINSFKSTGTHGLLKQGAKLVEHALDVVEELTHVLEQPPATGAADQPRRPGDRYRHLADPDKRRVIEVLEPYPLHIDTVACKAGLSPSRLAAVLLQLELDGLVIQSTGKMFAICEG